MTGRVVHTQEGIATLQGDEIGLWRDVQGSTKGNMNFCSWDAVIQSKSTGWDLSWGGLLVPGGQPIWAWARGVLQQQGKVILGQIRANFVLAVLSVWNMHSQTHIPCLTGHYFFRLRFLLFNYLFHSDASDVYIPILDSCRILLSSSGFLT